MKECKMYKCEYCRSFYDKEQDAIECEQRHQHIKEIVNVEYKQNDTYPTSIRVIFENGRSRTYTR